MHSYEAIPSLPWNLQEFDHLEVVTVTVFEFRPSHSRTPAPTDYQTGHGAMAFQLLPNQRLSQLGVMLVPVEHKIETAKFKRTLHQTGIADR